MFGKCLNSVCVCVCTRESCLRVYAVVVFSTALELVAVAGSAGGVTGPGSY